MPTENTDYIILRKTPYHETSLILAGITSYHGRIDLLVKGAKKIGSKTLPAIDLFREINININPEKNGLEVIYSAELISDFDNIAMNKKNYLDACEISKFILRNSQPAIPSPETYMAVKTAFKSLASENEKNCSSLVKLLFLDEHGMLPELPETRKQDAEILKQLLGAAKGNCEIPDISEEYMSKIAAWINSMCEFNKL